MFWNVSISLSTVELEERKRAIIGGRSIGFGAYFSVHEVSLRRGNERHSAVDHIVSHDRGGLQDFFETYSKIMGQKSGKSYCKCIVAMRVASCVSARWLGVGVWSFLK